MAAIIRLKRKACDEPADGLVIALKKTKCELTDTKQVLFKFAATLNSEKESVRDHIHAALSKEKTAKQFKHRNPKDTSINENKVNKVREKLLAEHKSANEKKKLDYLNNKRLILAEEFQDLEEDSITKDAEVRQLFHLYDIIEENEEVKKQNDEMESTITCNNEPLIREKLDSYVFDVYIADGHIDRTFIDGTVSVRACSLNADDIYFGDSDSSEECYEDEDDSNDENNWRNDYPEEEDSNSEKDSSDSEPDICHFNGPPDEYHDAILAREFNDIYIGDSEEEDEFDYANYERVLKSFGELEEEDDDEDENDD